MFDSSSASTDPAPELTAEQIDALAALGVNPQDIQSVAQGLTTAQRAIFLDPDILDAIKGLPTEVRQQLANDREAAGKIATALGNIASASPEELESMKSGGADVPQAAQTIVDRAIEERQSQLQAQSVTSQVTNAAIGIGSASISTPSTDPTAKKPEKTQEQLEAEKKKEKGGMDLLVQIVTALISGKGLSELLSAVEKDANSPNTDTIDQTKTTTPKSSADVAIIKNNTTTTALGNEKVPIIFSTAIPDNPLFAKLTNGVVPPSLAQYSNDNSVENSVASLASLGTLSPPTANTPQEMLAQQMQQARNTATEVTFGV